MVVINFKAPIGLIKIYMALSYPVDLAKSKDFKAFLSRKIQVSSARGAVNERVEIERGKSAVIFVVLIFDNVSYLNRIEAAPFDCKSEILFARLFARLRAGKPDLSRKFETTVVYPGSVSRNRGIDSSVVVYDAVSFIVAGVTVRGLPQSVEKRPLRGEVVAFYVHFEDSESVLNRAFAVFLGVNLIRPGHVRNKGVLNTRQSNASVKIAFCVYFEDIFLVRGNRVAVRAVREDLFARFRVVQRDVGSGFAVIVGRERAACGSTLGNVVAVEEQIFFLLMNESEEIELVLSERFSVFLDAVYARRAVDI